MRIISLRTLLLFLVALLPVLPVGAQKPEVSYKQLDEDLGLAQNFVYTVLRDKKGLIWVGTGKGLSRYNGLKIRTFTEKDGLAKSFVTSSFATSSGQLLFGHFQGAMSIYNGVSFKQIIDDTLNSDVVCIAEDENRQVWCATHSKGLIKWDEHFIRYQSIFPEELKGKVINQIKVVNNLLLAATNEGLYIYRITPKGLIFDSAPEEFLFQDVSSLEMLHDSDRQCWVGTADMGIYILQLEKKITISSPQDFDWLKKVHIKSIAQHGPHAIWIGTFQKGTFQLKFKEGYVLTEKNHFNESTGFPMSSVSTILADKKTKGTAWIGTLHNGLIRLTEPLFDHYTPPPTYGIKTINGIAEGEKGDFFLATNAGLFGFKLKSLKNSKKKAFKPLDVLNKQVLLSVIYFKNTLWVGTRNRGVRTFRRKNGKLEEIPLVAPELKDLKARFFEPDKAGNLWISAISKGVLKVDSTGKILEQHSTKTGFVHNDIFTVHPGKNGEVWFGSLGAGLARIDAHGKLRRFSQQGVFPSYDVKSITEDDEGNIWIATDGSGYFRFDGKTFEKMSTDDENNPLYIRKIGYDRQGKLWIVNQKKLSYLDLKSKKTRVFEKSHKLPRDRDYTSSIFFATQSNVLIANGKGLVHFNLENVPPSIKLPTYLVDLQISFKSYTEKQPSKEEILKGAYPSLKLNYEQRHITFNYIAIDPSYNGPVYYRYYIEGVEPTWSPPTKQHMITYSTINPGRHTFHVQASHDPNQWDNKEMVYSLMLEIPYWETGWFYLLQIFGIISLFGFTYLTARNPTSKKSISRVMIFACVFVVLEYVQTWSEPFVVDVVGSITAYKVVFNFLLALFLLPLERIFRLFLGGNRNLYQKQPHAKGDNYVGKVTYE